MSRRMEGPDAHCDVGSHGEVSFPVVASVAATSTCTLCGERFTATREHEAFCPPCFAAYNDGFCAYCGKREDCTCRGELAG